MRPILCSLVSTSTFCQTFVLFLLLKDQGQGGAQGIEDGVAFGLAFQGATNKLEVEQRLQQYEKIRKNRAASIQILSNFGADEGVPQELAEYLDGVELPSKSFP
jgi:salicylate hydroxylase